MTRNFEAFSWGVAAGVASCFGCWIIAILSKIGSLAWAVYFWPSSIFLITDYDNHQIAFWFILALTVIANALPYGGVFVLARLAWNRLSARRRNV